MSNLSEHDTRQISKMLDCLKEFQEGNMTLDRLYGNLEFLWYHLSDTINSEAKYSLKEKIDHLEILNASRLENIIDDKASQIESRKTSDKIRAQLDLLKL